MRNWLKGACIGATIGIIVFIYEIIKSYDAIFTEGSEIFGIIFGIPAFFVIVVFFSVIGAILGSLAQYIINKTKGRV